MPQLFETIDQPEDFYESTYEVLALTQTSVCPAPTKDWSLFFTMNTHSWRAIFRFLRSLSCFEGGLVNKSNWQAFQPNHWTFIPLIFSFYSFIQWNPGVNNCFDNSLSIFCCNSLPRFKRCFLGCTSKWNVMDLLNDVVIIDLRALRTLVVTSLFSLEQVHLLLKCFSINKHNNKHNNKLIKRY